MRIFAAIVLCLIISTCTNHRKQKHEIQFDKAMEFFRSGEEEKSIVLANELISKSENAFIVGQSQFLRAHIYQSRDSSELAYQDYIHALQNYRVSGRIDYQSIIECKIGNLLYEYDSYKYAKKHFLKAKSLAESINNEELTSDALYGLGRTEKRLGNLIEAQSIMFQVLEMEANLERLAYFIDAKLELAVIYHLGTSYNNAIEKNFEAIKTATDTKLENYTRARALNNIGGTYLKMKNYEKAKKYLSESIKTEGRFDVQKAMTYNNIARLFHEQGDDLSAARCFKKSVELNKYQVDVETLFSTVEGIKKLNVSDKEILSFAQIAETALREAHIKKKLEYAEARNFLEAEEMSRMLSEMDAQKQKLTLALIVSTLIIILSLTYILVKVFSSRKFTPSTLTDDQLSYIRERERRRKQWEEKLKG